MPTAGKVIQQKQDDLFTVPALVPMGELSLHAARMLADLAERFGDGVIHLTPDQNAELHDVRGNNVAATIAAIESAGLRTAGRGGISDVLSCVGLEYCPLAVTHSMAMGEELSLALAARRNDPRYVDFRIHVSGCPHSCAKHQVADVGLAVSTVLPVLVALIQAEPGQLVYIDQPDLHLHPSAQVLIAQMLANAANRGVRLVIETHSSLLLQGILTCVAKGSITPEKVALHWFARDEEGVTSVTTANIDAEGRFGDWPSDFDDVELKATNDYLDAMETKLMASKGSA